MKAFLDTHAAVALYEGERQVFGRRSVDLMERSALFVSPMVRLELVFLHQIGRLVVDADEILGVLAAELGVSQADDPMAAVVTQAIPLTWTRDPFDRLLVATAALHRAPLITQDQDILDNFSDAAW